MNEKLLKSVISSCVKEYMSKHEASMDKNVVKPSNPTKTLSKSQQQKKTKSDLLKLCTEKGINTKEKKEVYKTRSLRDLRNDLDAVQ